MMNRTAVELLKTRYPKGTRICLDHIGDDPRPIADNSKGTVAMVDDIGTVHVDFDNGCRLGLVYGEDEFHIIKD